MALEMERQSQIRMHVHLGRDRTGLRVHDPQEDGRRIPAALCRHGVRRQRARTLRAHHLGKFKRYSVDQLFGTPPLYLFSTSRFLQKDFASLFYNQRPIEK